MSVATAVNVVLDDDPTGVQAVRDVAVVLAWTDERLRRAAATGRPAIHVMTNIRSLPAGEAEAVTFAAASAAHSAIPGSRLVLRGDSTLRGHLHEEYRAVRRAVFPQRPPVLLLVPALPAAGRVTIDGTHWLVAEGVRRPLNETEYAHDGCFAYHSARLLEWAEERTGGEMAAGDGTEVPLAQLRDRGPESVCEAIMSAASSGRPAACVPDVETIDDLTAIAQGLVKAEQGGTDVLVRCGPTFAGVLAGTLAQQFVEPPRAGEQGVLIVCGSYVSGTTRQLLHLESDLGIKTIEPDVHALAFGDAQAEVSRVAALARKQLAERGLALVSSPRERPADLVELDAGERIAGGLAEVVAALDPRPHVIIAKGGITSQVVIEHGLHAHEARVVGPVAAGVALWEIESRGQKTEYLVFPGNVGGPDHLTHVAKLVTGA